MKKYLIYQLAIFYQQKVENKELTLSLKRYLRDAFKPYVDTARSIETDRQEIVGKEIEDEEKSAEIKTLFDESVELTKPTAELLEKIDEAKIEVSEFDLTLLEESLK